MAYPLRKTCKRKHEWTEENTRIDARGSRICRACNRERYQKREKATHCKNGHAFLTPRLDGASHRRRECPICRDITSAKWREKNKQRARESRFRNEYGITIAEYDSLLEKQHGRCLICDQNPGYPLHVDHCHETGVLRGLLCRMCNPGLGWFGDSPERLRRAADYLEAYRA